MFRRRFFLFLLLVVVLVAEAVVVVELMAVASPELMAMVLTELTEGVSSELTASSMTVARKLVGKIYDCRVINWLCSMMVVMPISISWYTCCRSYIDSIAWILLFALASNLIEGGSGDPPNSPKTFQNAGGCRHHF